MDWLKVVSTICELRAEFDKSFKCFNKSGNISNTKKVKHNRVLLNSFNAVRQIVINNLGKCDSLRELQLRDGIKRLRENLLYVAERHKLHILVSNTLNFPAEFDESALLESESTEPEEPKLKKTISQFSDSETNCSMVDKSSAMSQSPKGRTLNKFYMHCQNLMEKI